MRPCYVFSNKPKNSPTSGVDRCILGRGHSAQVRFNGGARPLTGRDGSYGLELASLDFGHRKSPSRRSILFKCFSTCALCESAVFPWV